MESTDLIPLSGDVAKITKRAEEFKELHDALQRNLHVYLQLTMDALAGAHQKIKSSVVPETTRQMVSFNIVCGDRYSVFLSDVGQRQEEIKVSDGVCWNSEVQDVTRHLFILGKARRRDRSLMSIIFSFVVMYCNVCICFACPQRSSTPLRSCICFLCTFLNLCASLNFFIFRILSCILRLVLSARLERRQTFA